MKPSRVAEVLKKLIDTRWPAFVWGPPGVGKSSVVRSVAADMKLDVLDLRASLLDPTDLRGIPSIVKGEAVWCPPSFLPKRDAKPGLLFLDEINAAPPLVQASLYQLVLDRRIGEYELPEGWRIVAAGNRSGDRAVVFRLSSALANRFVHLDFDVDFEDWRHWAMNAGIASEVIGFLGLRRNLLLTPQQEGMAYATPRTWHMASDALRSFGGAAAARDVLPGIVGEGPATEFIQFAKKALREDDFLAIVANPETAKLPEGLGDLYALVSWIPPQSDKPEIRTAAGKLLSRLEPELAVLLARDLLRRFPRFAADAGYQQFVKTHGRLLT
jgi:hypothetical protein